MTKNEYLRLLVELTELKNEAAMAAMIPKPENIYYQLHKQYAFELEVYKKLLKRS